jgi:vitamin B12 transporter
MYSSRLSLLLAAAVAAPFAARAAGAQRAAPSDSAARDTATRDTATRDTAALRPVVVTATRVVVPQAAPTATATVITGEQLRARGITHLVDALRDIPGAAVLQNGSFGAQASLFLRGGESKYVQVLVDGVPVNDPGGSFNFANLTVDNVDRIEVLRGPASVLYGSDAVTGVVQVFTRRGAPATDLSLAARGGSFGTAEGEGRAAGSLAAGRLGWSAGASHYGSDGILAFNNAYRNESGSAALRWADGGRGDLTLAVRGQHAQYNYPTDGSGAIVDRNSFRRDERGTVSLEGGRRLLPRLEARAQLGLTEAHGRNDDRPDSRADTLGFSQGFVSHDGTTRRNADARLNYYFTPRTVLTVGGDYRAALVRSVDSSFYKTGPAPGTRFRATRDSRAVYAQLLGDVRSVVTLTLGGRYDDNSAFGAFRTVRAGIGTTLPTGTGLRAAAGNAFREPTMQENFARAPFNRGNALLRPERTRSVEAGLTQQLLGGRVSLGATWYLQRFRDMIQYGSATRNAAGDSVNYFNVAGANAGGVELEARVRPAASLSVDASYTVSDTRVTNAGLQSGQGATFVTGNRLLRRPADLAALTVTRLLASRGFVALRVNRTGRRDDRDFNVFPARPLVLPAYTTVSLAADVAMLHASAGRPGVALTARAENLLDKGYQPVFGFDAPGRTLVAGVRVGSR